MKFVLLLLVAALSLNSIAAQNCEPKQGTKFTFNQCDPAWGGNQLGSSSTICRVGCAMCSVAAGLALKGKTINGKWRLKIADESPGDTGYLTYARLVIRGRY